MAQQLRPEKFGEVPPGLPPGHADFLRRLRDAVEQMAGVQKSQVDSRVAPASQTVTFGDLDAALRAMGDETGYSKIFMHMGAL